MNTLFENNMDLEQPDFFLDEGKRYVIENWVQMNKQPGNIKQKFKYYRVKLQNEDQYQPDDNSGHLGKFDIFLNYWPDSRAIYTLAYHFSLYKTRKLHIIAGIPTQTVRLWEGIYTYQPNMSEYEVIKQGLKKDADKIYIPEDLIRDAIS